MEVRVVKREPRFSTPAAQAPPQKGDPRRVSTGKTTSPTPPPEARVRCTTSPYDAVVPPPPQAPKQKRQKRQKRAEFHMLA